MLAPLTPHNALLQTAADRLAAADVAACRCLVGFDGFIDDIIDVVDVRRTMRRDDYDRLETMTDYASRVAAFAAKSMNLELVVKESRFGGNGPLMAGGLAMLGASTSYIGCIGQADDPSRLHPLYAELDQRCRATGGQTIPIAPPAHTLALEFADGKIMQGNPANLYRVTWPDLKARLGLDRLIADCSAASLIGIVNWVMMPSVGGHGGIWEGLTREVFPAITPHPTGTRRVFIDLCDPARRTDDDVSLALTQLTAMNAVRTKLGQQTVEVTLGLNLAEALRVDRVSGSGGFASLAAGAHPTPAQLTEAAARIRAKLNLSCVVIHPREGAAAADLHDEPAWVDGPLCEKPKLSTGAGDHFNSGFALAQSLGMSTRQALAIATAVSGVYVRDAQSPTRARLVEFLRAGW